MTAESPGPQRAAVARGETVSPVGKPDSPAAQQLAELSEKDAKQGVKSRLRRAFSFGSASELRRASAANSANHASAERARLRKERYQDEEEAKQAAIVQKQEAGGIGEGIYSGQGHFFTGSSDNLSVSSTASSASVMIRKMGKGMKKSSRSLVGLFRPRSVVGVPAAGATDSSVPGASEAQVSMVTAEAERQKVNVNVDPHDQAGGGTGFPRLERNSLDVAGASGAVADSDQASSVHSEAHESSRARRSIVGGDLERAEVLAAVRKGILKRECNPFSTFPPSPPFFYFSPFSGLALGILTFSSTSLTRDAGRNQPSAKPSYSSTTASSPPAMRPLESKLPEFVLPAVPRVCDSPHSSAPTTPAEEGSPSLGHRRTDSVRIEGEDYFAGLPRMLTTEVKSDLDTPTGITKYAVSFSPRIQFHDTWPSGEYDRRGEIATCNRLTPMLAQQIKEELNTFKMVRLDSVRLTLSRTDPDTRLAGDGCARAIQGLHPLFLKARPGHVAAVCPLSSHSRTDWLLGWTLATGFPPILFLSVPSFRKPTHGIESQPNPPIETEENISRFLSRSSDGLNVCVGVCGI